jgi:hypothetical protein
MINNISIKDYSKDDKVSIINLLGYLMKGFSESEIIELFEWRYERNPYNSQPIIILAFSGDTLVGFRAYLIQYFVISDKKMTVISPADTIIHPEYRRRGIHSMLNKQSLEKLHLEYPNSSILLNTTTSRNAMPAYLKADWSPCSHKNKVYGYRFSIFNIFKSLLKKDENSNHVDKISFSNAGLILEVTNKIDKNKILEFIKNNRDKSKLTNIRDEFFFDWRYSHERDKYLLILCYSNRTMVGYSILKKSSNYEYSIEEYLAVDTKILRSMLKGIQRKLKIPILRTIIFSEEDKRRMKSCDFFVESNLFIKIFKKQRFPVLVRPTKPNLSDDDFLIEGIDIRDIENWQLFQSDRH